MKDRKISAEPTTAEALEAAEEVLDGFTQADFALERLCELSGLDPEALRLSSGIWAAQVIFDDTCVLLYSEPRDRWGVCAPSETDDADAMAAARDIHGLLGTRSEGWDLDR